MANKDIKTQDTSHVKT